MGDKEGACSAKLRSRDLADGQSYGTLRPNGHDVCLFRSGCHNTPTTDRSGVLTSVMYFSRMQEASNLIDRVYKYVSIIENKKMQFRINYN